MKKLLCLVLLSSACSPDFPECRKDSVIIHGLCINRPSDLDDDMIKTVIEKVHEYEGIDIELAAYMYQNMGITINWTTDNLGDEEAGFFQYYSTPTTRKGAIFLLVRDSFTINYRVFILVHELFHMMWWVDSNNADDDHLYLGVTMNDAFMRQTDDYLAYSELRRELGLP